MARVPVTIKIPPPRVVPLMVRSPFKKVISRTRLAPDIDTANLDKIEWAS